ncbi:hypothetical protein ACFL4C_02150 [Candidatus Omnitrophota bacterium]
MEELIIELYDEWDVCKYLTRAEYANFVKDSYQVLIKSAKEGKMILYEELPVFDELKGRFGDTLSTLIDSIIGACSEYEATKSRPLISAIVVGQETREPGRGFYGLSDIPYSLCHGTWEEQDIEPPQIVINKRQELWLSELKEALEYWGKHDV